ncbi:MAG: type II toxin-antitoxin system HicA family toxin [Acidobacteria bacterium]|nr:type II toxin-antitoxin system HicA family toxin [Acidobacteriota bacterium]
MPRLGPTSRKDLIRFLYQLGFSGPFSGGKHQFMIRGSLRVAIPNPHVGEIATGLLARILRQAGIDKSEWEKL